jgi:ATP-dependent Clp protease ATP-binding subunit ClpB
MTSNTGSQLIQNEFTNLTEHNQTKLIDSTRLKVMDLLKQSIKPEFLNRIDEIIVFTPLFKKDIKQIVKLQFNIIKKRLANNHISIEMSENAAQLLAEQGYDPVYGARPLKRVMQRSILNQLSKSIIAGEITQENKILIDTENGELVFKNR